MLIPYSKYVKVLKYLTISLLAYIITALIVGGNLEHILAATIIPHFEFTPVFAMMFVAIFGATLTPYAFFWQASEEAEEDVAKHKIAEISGTNNGNGNNNLPKISKEELKAMKLDVATGMALSQVVMWAIIITTATTLHANNITDIKTADQAAISLQPLVKGFPFSGEISKTIFALGIIGTGLLAIPVLAVASGYAWKEGLNKSFSQAKNFHLIIAASTIIGLLINFTNIDLIKALVYSSTINGIVAAPILVAVTKVANDKNILKDKINSKLSNIIGWIIVITMGISVIIMVFTWGHQ